MTKGFKTEGFKTEGGDAADFEVGKVKTEKFKAKKSKAGEFKVVIVTHDSGVEREQVFSFQQGPENQRPMALDVLLQAQNTDMPDLAYRYGCRNALCGVCTIDVNGKPKLACRTKLRNGDRLSALSSLKPIRDLVVDRAPVNRQLRTRLPVRTGELGCQAAEDLSAYQSLNRCIECYACLSGCPMHERNLHDDACDENESANNDPDITKTWGNPYALLKIQQVRLDPRSSQADCNQAFELGRELGLDACVECKGCRCGVGIDLKKEVIAPLITELKANAADLTTSDK